MDFIHMFEEAQRISNIFEKECRFFFKLCNSDSLVCITTNAVQCIFLFRNLADNLAKIIPKTFWQIDILFSQKIFSYNNLCCTAAHYWMVVYQV